MARALTYKAAGVDIELKQALIPRFRRLARAATGANILEGIGGFGAIIGLNGAARMREPVLVAGADGVGTKLKIAFATGKHDTVGIDCVAMCANDIICHNARPLFFLDYIGCGKLKSEIALAIVKGIARGCALAEMSLVGGETAQLPGMYKAGEYDLAGFAVGIADRKRIPDPVRIKAGDVLVGLASDGLHSNGFALARKALLERARMRLNVHIAEIGCTLAEELLRPTRIYARIASELFERFPLRGLANITGGGMPENLPRVMPPNLQAVVRRGSWPVPPIFDLIARLGKISRAEMDRTFNNGVGMVAIIPPSKADEAIRALRRRKQRAFVIGEVRQGPGGVVFA
ncbi:MAG TPA: phosphoribosylformylglycinamidine cyclo-ligase [Candidatus Binataceae bacterium]|nr:phosphoribosylformylglycinamidine cyclo-ligase [Candidatus Binataceae bacterium]